MVPLHRQNFIGWAAYRAIATPFVQQRNADAGGDHVREAPAVEDLQQLLPLAPAQGQGEPHRLRTGRVSVTLSCVCLLCSDEKSSRKNYLANSGLQ